MTRPSARIKRRSAGAPSSHTTSPAFMRTKVMTHERGFRLRPTLRLRKIGTVCSVRTIHSRWSSRRSIAQSRRSPSRTCRSRLGSITKAVSTASRSPTKADSAKHAPGFNCRSKEKRDEVHRTDPDKRTKHEAATPSSRSWPS
eukprot:scaffold100326_cov31-Tisochrysis_lutea.AAC.3